MLKNIALAIFSAALLAAPWLEEALSPLACLGLVPLLWAERNISKTTKSKSTGNWLALTLAFSFSWTALIQLPNFGALSWISYALTIFAVLGLFRFVKTTLGKQRGYIALPFLWISAEALHFYLNLGVKPKALGQLLQCFDAFSNWHDLIGNFGSGLWLITINILVFLILNSFSLHRQWKPLVGQSVVLIALVVLAPVIISSYFESEKPVQTEVRENSQPKPNFKDREDPRLIPSRLSVSLSGTDRFVARLSFFLAGFLILFAFVKGYLDQKNAIK